MMSKPIRIKRGKDALCDPASKFYSSLSLHSIFSAASLSIYRERNRRCAGRPRLGETRGDVYLHTNLGQSLYRCDGLGGPERPEFSQENLRILGWPTSVSCPLSRPDP